MVTRLQGRVNGSDIIFSRVEGDLWECTVPAPEAFEAVVELCAYDEAGNYCYAARYYLLFDPESLEIRLLPIDYWLEVTGRDMWLETGKSIPLILQKILPVRSRAVKK